MNIRSLRSSRAFTLIELLIVITIIGILAVALLPRITAGPAKARDAQRKADLQQLATAIALWADDNSGSYPTSSTTGCASGLTLTSYMTAAPSDPKTSTPTYTWPCSGGGYSYIKTSDGFVVSAILESSSATGTGIYGAKWMNSVSTSTSTSSNASTFNTSYLCSVLASGTAPCSAAAVGAAQAIFR